MKTLIKYKDKVYSANIEFEKKYQKLVLSDLVKDVVKRNSQVGQMPGLFQSLKKI